ncbi:MULTISPECIES: hypothetical protein [Actinosynnema]|uniref:DUF7341 domain-containing protein n=1 Tax=Actinosynnema TaxID=40566 RepID=UPI0020A2DD2F|nr:hypothetical protein [Actinosynnema pretiosum]MCP2092681.1 hypothetical protein [Actinosynnema pretiosum]
MNAAHEQHHEFVPDPPSRDEAATARLTWEASVDQLVMPGLYVLHRQDDRHEVAEVLPLLKQVQEAVMPQGRRSGPAGALGSRPPASLGALSLLGEIGAEVDRTCCGHGHDARGLPERVRAWVAHAEPWQHHDPEYVLWAAELSQGWVRAARALLDPAPRYPLRGRACPTCGTATVQAWSEDAEDWVRRPALSVDPEQAQVVCADCGRCWPLDAWVQLGELMDAQLSHETWTG